VFNKKATKIDQDGCQDLLTGERNMHILKTDIEVRTWHITNSSMARFSAKEMEASCEQAS
jgi:hypothetical protein